MKQMVRWMVVVLWLVSGHSFAATGDKALLSQVAELNDKAFDYYQQGNYSEALKTFQAASVIMEKILGKQHPATATSYNNIGSTYDSMGDYPKALEFKQKSLTIKEKVLGKQNPGTARSYNNIGGTYDAMGDYPKALEFYQKSLTIREKVLGKQHPDTAGSYNNIGATYHFMGDDSKALAFYQKSLTIREKVLGKLHPDTAQSYNNIGETYRVMGNYLKALEFHQKSLTISEKILGKQHPATATSYNNIGITYQLMGDYPKALEFYQKSLTIKEKVLGKQHLDTATSYNNIGGTYDAMGDYPKALEFYKKALTTREKVLGKQHPDTAGSYNNIGGTYNSMGDYPKALEFYKKALTTREKVLGKQHPDTAGSYNNIGGTYDAMGDYPKALEFYKKSLTIREKVLGKQHPDMAQSYNNIGATYGSMEDYANAYRYAKKAFTIFLQQRDSNFSALDSAQKKQYLTANENWIDFLLRYTQHYQQMLRNNKQPQQAADLAQTTLNDWLAYKGSILDSENRLIQLAKSSKDPAIQKKYQALVELKKSYSALNQKPPANAEKEAWQQQLKQQKERIATLEHAITQADPRFKTEKGLQKITSKTIATGLSDNELYIDYGKTNDGYYLFTIDHDNAISFTAFTKKDSKAIDQQLALFGEDIEAIIDEDEIPEDLQEKSKASLSQLYQLLITPALAAKIASKDSLIISPDGGLRLLPFEALYNTAKKQYLIEQKDIRYIASGKELVRLFRQQTDKESKASKDNKAVLFANPDFNKNDVKKSQQPTAIYTRNTRRGRLRSGAFAPLKGTQIEAEAIIDILQKSNVRHYYTQGDASEANLVTIKQPSILHIATHGFFDAETPNPMLQSGLVFAGANVSLQNDTGEGIVTALDLSGLDLKGTDLVVLSACETGKVDPNNTNGVSGLTKAFIQAGAKDVVMSLWEVSDDETAHLMQSFYRVSQQNDRHYADALKQSKLTMIKDGLHPYYWAAFVLSGL